MGEERENKGTEFSFIQEKVKQKSIYQNRLLRKAAMSVFCGALFALSALLIWALAAPRLKLKAEEQEILPINIPEEVPESEEEVSEPPEAVSYTHLDVYKRQPLYTAWGDCRCKAKRIQDRRSGYR